MINTPDDVIRELDALRKQSEAGIEFLADLEAQLVQADLDYDRARALAFIDAKGTVGDRESLALLKSADAREKAQLLRVQVNRAKQHVRHLGEALGSVQTSARMVELTWKTTR